MIRAGVKGTDAVDGIDAADGDGDVVPVGSARLFVELRRLRGVRMMKSRVKSSGTAASWSAGADCASARVDGALVQAVNAMMVVNKRSDSASGRKQHRTGETAGVVDDRWWRRRMPESVLIVWRVAND